MKLISRISLVATTLVTAAVTAAILSGCGDDPAQSAQIQKQIKNPTIENVGTFDGCEVKFVNRYYQQLSFYIARCGSTATRTENVRVQADRHSSRIETKMSITDELADIESQRHQLDEQEAALKARKAALAKLTPEEQAALGLPKSDK